MGATVRSAVSGLLILGLLGACTPSNQMVGNPSGTTAPSGPASESAQGVAYSLVIHCGVRVVAFDGANWEAMPPVPSIPDSVTDPATGTATGRYEVKGRMLRISENRARFTTTEPPVGVVVEFARTTSTPEKCA
jgi:hypothetical protein